MVIVYLILKLVRVATLPCILLTACQCCCEKISPDVLFSNEIINIFSKEMNEKYGLKCIGTGGNLNKSIQKLTVKFVAYRNATLEEARELEINANERFLQLINSHKKIRPYLNEYPFTYNSAYVSISFHKPNENYYLDDSIAHVFIAKHKVFFDKAGLIKRKSIPIRSMDGRPLPSYMTEQKETVTETLIPFYNEPYDEALKIVRENPSCLNDSKNASTK
jgi:hypothetical protein